MSCFNMDFYTDDKLNADNARAIACYDMAVDEVETAKANILEVYYGKMPKALEALTTQMIDEICDCVIAYLKNYRDEIVVSMIDEQEQGND